jgi:hypothetical protein
MHRDLTHRLALLAGPRKIERLLSASSYPTTAVIGRVSLRSWKVNAVIPPSEIAALDVEDLHLDGAGSR